MAEAVVTAVIDVLINKLVSPEVLNLFQHKKLGNGQLKKLNLSMRSVHKVLNDAEAKQITDPEVKAWLNDLRNVMFEADDFLDGIAYEALQMEVEAQAQDQTCKGKSKVRNFLSSLKPHKNGNGKKNEQLKKILHSLEGLVQQKDTLGLIEGIGEKAWSPKIPTTSLLRDTHVYGRDGDKDVIVKLLLSEDANGKNLDVIPIVGMGGVGKTTLAQLVYNDTRVMQWFDLKAWVCISEESNILKVTKDILKEVGLMNCDAMTPNQLHLELKQRLMRKKFLLVLDDIWNEDRDAWDFLLTPLKSGSTQGSKIVITTRSQIVASIMSTVPTHHLHELSQDDCWHVFAQHAFDSGSSSGHGDLEEIGLKIVEKCKGLPLAAKSLGSLLRCNTNVEEWEKILESSIWGSPDDKILPALKLSYHCLPSHLKQCFAYCALLPKDYEFQREDLVLWWMAEGFLEQPQGKEIDGNRCFDDLVSRSFFQRSTVNPSCFIMHDLINDLAKFVSGEFCFRYEDGDSSKPNEKTRYLSHARTGHEAIEDTEGLTDAQFLRSFLLIGRPRCYSCGNMENVFLEWDTSKYSLQNLQRLRVFSLCNYYKITLLPDSMGYLRNLPTNMKKLINLSHLDIRETYLRSMPPGMGNLTKLKRLNYFLVGKESGCSIAELGKLQYLEEELGIYNLRNVVNVQDAREANLKGKKLIKELVLSWDYGDSSCEVSEEFNGCTDVSEHQVRVLDQLQPHTKVKNLSIQSYGGMRFPNWVGDSSFSNIVSLKLSNCACCSSLPPLGQLAALKELTISSFDAVVSVGPEFYGRCAQPFRSLDTLTFESMPKWREWICDIDGAFPLLRELHISMCPYLSKARPSHLHSLTTVEITRCEQLLVSLPRAPSILKMTLWDLSHDMKLEKFPSGLLYSLAVGGSYSLDFALKAIEQIGVASTSLEEMTICDCDLKSLCPDEGSFGDFTSLRFLEMRRCHDLLAFPEGGISAPNLTRLELSNCEILKCLPGRMHSLLPSLMELCIEECPEIEGIPEGHFPSKLVSLEVRGCQKLTANFGIQWDLRCLPSFTRLCIDVESFPEKKLLPSTLTSLDICKVQNLESLDREKTLKHLTSLTKLIIEDWPHLQSIREEGLPSTVTSVEILFLDNLQSLEIQHLTSLEKLHIKCCPKLESIPKESLPSTLSSLRIWSLENLQSLGMRSLTSLEELAIHGCPKLELIPEGLPSTLASLNIWDLENLHSLAFQHLNSLEKLEIYYCPKLESFPDVLPSSLSYLYISGCPLLAERCRQEEGEDWPKISHIPSIHILG